MRNMESMHAGVPEGGAMPRAYGCLFCITGREWDMASSIRRYCPGVRAIVAARERHRTIDGVKTRDIQVILPGYVFFEADAAFDPFRSLPREHNLRVLTLETGLWQLGGDDLRFAEWLFQYDGLLGFSKAYREGEQIRITGGPLKDMEGSLVKVDKRGRSGQVCLTFNGREIRVWLGFDLIDPAGPVMGVND